LQARVRQIRAQIRLHLARGYSSLFDFATRELGYSPGAAQRRILAMGEIPELERKIEEGRITLDSAAKALVFFKLEEKAANPFSLEQKREVLSQLENQSFRHCDRVLAALSSDTESFLKPDNIKEVGSGSVEIRFVAREKLAEDLDRIRELLS
jgi:hypothetical protein